MLKIYSNPPPPHTYNSINKRPIKSVCGCHIIPLSLSELLIWPNNLIISIPIQKPRTSRHHQNRIQMYKERSNLCVWRREWIAHLRYHNVMSSLTRRVSWDVLSTHKPEGIADASEGGELNWDSIKSFFFFKFLFLLLLLNDLSFLLQATLLTISKARTLSKYINSFSYSAHINQRDERATTSSIYTCSIPFA